jgi:cytochrome c biogenesis protein CcmG, thiol:disulfide interchange protein DsbE
MSMKRSIEVLFGSLAALLLAGCGASDPPPIELGDAAPAFSLPTVSQVPGRVTSEDLKGKIAVLNLWSTTCAVCLKETEELAQIHRRGKSVVIGVALETNIDYVRRCINERAETDTIALGDEATFGRFDGYAVPYTVVLDRSGVIRLKVYGRIEANELEKVIDRIDNQSVAFGPVSPRWAVR